MYEENDPGELVLQSGLNWTLWLDWFCLFGKISGLSSISFRFEPTLIELSPFSLRAHEYNLLQTLICSLLQFSCPELICYSQILVSFELASVYLSIYVNKLF